MLTRRQFIPPQKLIPKPDPVPASWQEGHVHVVRRLDEVEQYLNRFQEAVKGYFDWFARPGALEFFSGTYTPTIAEAGIANITGNPTVYESRYIKMGEVVFVSGRAAIQCDSTALDTLFTISLPVATTIPTNGASGVIGNSYSTSGGGTIIDNGATVQGQYRATTTTNAEVVAWQFSYRLA